jgi:fructose PTS system EIIBC or EIIC component
MCTLAVASPILHRNKEKQPLADLVVSASSAEIARLSVRSQDEPGAGAPDLVVSSLAGTTKIAAIKELVDGLHRRGVVLDSLGFLQSVLARETLQSTIAADGIAMPHARCHSVTRLAAAVGLAQPPLEYASGDDLRRIGVICLIAVPTHSPSLYLEWMGALARRLSEPGVRARLSAAANPERVLELLVLDEPSARAAHRPPRDTL